MIVLPKISVNVGALVRCGGLFAAIAGLYGTFLAYPKYVALRDSQAATTQLESQWNTVQGNLDAERSRQDELHCQLEESFPDATRLTQIRTPLQRPNLNPNRSAFGEGISTIEKILQTCEDLHIEVEQVRRVEVQDPSDTSESNNCLRQQLELRCSFGQMRAAANAIVAGFERVRICELTFEAAETGVDYWSLTLCFAEGA